MVDRSNRSQHLATTSTPYERNRKGLGSPGEGRAGKTQATANCNDRSHRTRDRTFKIFGNLPGPVPPTERPVSRVETGIPADYCCHGLHRGAGI